MTPPFARKGEGNKNQQNDGNVITFCDERNVAQNLFHFEVVQAAQYLHPVLRALVSALSVHSLLFLSIHSTLT